MRRATFDTPTVPVVDIVSVELMEQLTPAEKPAQPEPSVNGTANGHTHTVLVATSGPATTDEERARRYLAKITPAVSGQKGSKTTFRAACVLVGSKFLLDKKTALKLLAEWNKKCQPEWSEAELNHKIDDAWKKCRSGDGGANDSCDGGQSPAGSGASGGASTPTAEAFRWEPITSAEFFAADYRPTWLVRRMFVKMQPVVIGGQKKCLKTSLVTDLAVSLASGTPFLGKFDVYQQQRVAFLSGESGEFTMQETGRRVCAARGIEPAGLGILWGFRLPQLDREEDLAELRKGLERDKVDVLFIDPLYLVLISGLSAKVKKKAEAGNLFDMGPLLLKVARACLDVGTTPALVHHFTKRAAQDYDPPDLDDLAFSGTAEFARQWLLVNRRSRYEEGTGHHELWLSAGGSCGQGGGWGVDVEEGELADDFSGRKWEVRVTGVRDARATEGDVRARQQSESRGRQHRDDETAVLDILGRLATYPDEFVRRTIIVAEARMSERRCLAAIERLSISGEVEVREIKAPGGNGAQVPAIGVRKVNPNTHPRT